MASRENLRADMAQEATESKRKFLRMPKLSLFHITVGVIVLFCMLSIIIWSVNVKSYRSNMPQELYILTYQNKTHATSSSTTKTDSTTAEATSAAPKTPVASTASPVPPIISVSSEGTTKSEYISTTTEVHDCDIVVPDNEKFDCIPDTPLNETECIKRGCCYKTSPQIIRSNISSLIFGIPSCYYPSNYSGYTVESIREEDYNSSPMTATLKRAVPSGFPKDIENLQLTVKTITENIMQIKIIDKQRYRFEAPIRQVIPKVIPKEKRVYDVKLSKNGDLTVSRKMSGTDIFKTKLSQLVYSDQFIQLTTALPSKYIYGLGEHYGKLLKSVNWTRFTFHNKDNFPEPDINIYGHHPFYLNIESNAYSHGVLLLNANSMDIILQPNPALTYRTIGGVLDFYFFFGPKPADVIREYTELIGRPHVPPYWSLGFHMCRYGVPLLNQTVEIWQRNVDAGYPFDVQWNDIDYMDRYNDFTYSKPQFEKLPEFVKQLHDMGMHYVVMFDPGVSNTEPSGTYPPYDDGMELDVFLKNDTGDLFIGKVWNPDSTVFPDFTHPNSTKYWVTQFKKFHDQINFDGAWIDMNEVSNFHCNGSLNYGCPESEWEDPPYVPGGMEPLRTKQICMTAKHYKTRYYNEHNLYGFRETMATYEAVKSVTNKRPFVITRSTFPGSGYYAGHWSGDIASSWEDMRYSVVNTLEFNIFGIPMIGTDICGFRKSTTEELCARWFALGGFYPFARDHNDINNVDQDPAGMGTRVATSARESLFLRYELLPYLYTLFFKSHIYGDTVVRPMFFEFPEDAETYALDEQFMWGPALMVMPVLYPGVNETTAYFPKGRWHSFYEDDAKVIQNGKYETLSADTDKINLYIRGGHIIPLQYANTTTTMSRMNKFYIIAGLDDNEEGSGELYWDDGDSIIPEPYTNHVYNHVQFSVQDRSFNSVVQHLRYNTTMTLDFIKLCELKQIPSYIQINERVTTVNTDAYANGCLKINLGEQSLLEPFRITWKYEGHH